MLPQLTSDNYFEVLGRFSVSDLETLVESHPFYQQAHLLLAKKYQQENNPKFDRQLQLAALYSQNRELLHAIFHTTSSITVPEFVSTAGIRTSVFEEQSTSDLNEEKQVVSKDLLTSEAEPDEEVLEAVAPFILEEAQQEPQAVADEIISTEPIESLTETEEQIATSSSEEIFIEEQTTFIEPVEVEEEVAPEVNEDSIEQIEEPVIVNEATDEPKEDVVESTSVSPEFNIKEPHTFDEWLQAFSTQPVEVEITEPAEEEAQEEEELDEIIESGVSADYLHELVKEETNYSKGLEEYIKDQVRKRKKPAIAPLANENDIDPSLVTETMAKVYEMQKKYAKAIRAYKLLSLKNPGKSDLFAARINYLKSIL